MPGVVGAVRLALCACVPLAASALVATVARFVPEPSVVLWLIRTTVVDAAAAPLPRLEIVQLAPSVPPAVTEVAPSAPPSTCRSGVVTAAVTAIGSSAVQTELKLD